MSTAYSNAHDLRVKNRAQMLVLPTGRLSRKIAPTQQPVGPVAIHRPSADAD